MEATKNEFQSLSRHPLQHVSAFRSGLLQFNVRRETHELAHAQMHPVAESRAKAVRCVFQNENIGVVSILKLKPNIQLQFCVKSTNFNVFKMF